MSAVARWDGFLAQIEGRAASVRAEAEAAANQFIASVAGGGDYLPLSHQLSAVASRLQELENMIMETWHAKVDDAICAEAREQRDGGREKGQALAHALDDAREELQIRIFAELARRRFASALVANRAVACGRCGAACAAPVSFRAIELACACGARTPFEPGELMRSVAAIGGHALAQEAAVVPWRAMRAAERRLHALRPPRELGVIKDSERSQIAYWRSYLAVRSQLEPELARDPAREIRSRMEQWYTTTAEFEEAWVRANRPRDAI